MQEKIVKTVVEFKVNDNPLDCENCIAKIYKFYDRLIKELNIRGYEPSLRIEFYPEDQN